jgi:hypothetical protein
MVDSHGLRARGVDRLGRVHVGSIRSTRVHMGRLTRLAQFVRGLAGLGDGPMSPSPRVVHSYMLYAIHHPR